ncbi:MAG: M4 family metallopeptidase [Candidatus Promineifilaceae bacterium]|nr:M4 family metallopeptidase [Candidatus Promineifilaceae bacterium]
MCSRANPIHCILPPYLLQEIKQNGTAVQQERAEQNLVNAQHIRAQRAATSGETAFVDADDAYTIVKERLVYDAEFGSILPGILVRGEGDPPLDDPAVNEAYDGAGATYDLFKDAYGRNSIDDRGMVIESTVHYREGYDNAFWNGRQMIYGDGDEDLPEDQRLFNRFTIAPDVIAHELTHGVTQFEAGLMYRDQPGALNESISDVFGALCNQHMHGQTAAEADWLIGKGLFTANVNGHAIRSLKDPGTAYDDPVLGRDIQPGHMEEYVQTREDSGGVHINSGIPNRAFYVVSVELGGFAWEKAGKIWYVALTEKLAGDSNFQDAAALTYLTAGELYGQGSIEQKAVRFGWAEVGIDIDNGNTGGGTPGGTRGGAGAQPTGCFQSIRSLSAFQWLRQKI